MQTPERVGAFSMHMVLYKDGVSITAYNIFDVNMSMIYGVRNSQLNGN